MVGPRIYHVHQTRKYAGLNAATAMDSMNSWLWKNDFRAKKRTPTFSRGCKRGVHVNFTPKFKLIVEPCSDGTVLVSFDYYGKMKVGTLVVVGVLTSGISTAVGVATYAMRLLEADEFAASFWAYVDTLARGPITVVKVERWGYDNSGHYVLQPVPGTAVQQPVVQQPVVVQQPYIVQQPYGSPQYVQQTYTTVQPQQPLVKSREIPAAGFVQAGAYSPQQVHYSPQPTYSSQSTYSQPTYSPQQAQPGSVYGHHQSFYPQTQYTAAPATPPTPQQPSASSSYHAQEPLVNVQDAQPSSHMYYPVLEPQQYSAGQYVSGYPQTR
jgi:hypothetical protein